MAGGVLYHTLTSAGLLSLGLYNLTAAAYSSLKHPREYSAKPFHPLPLPHHPRLRLLPLHLTSLLLLLSLIVHLSAAATPDPLVSVHALTSLQSSSVLLLFLLLSLLLLSPSFPPDLVFAAAAASFFLLSSASRSHSLSLASSSSLESKLFSLSSNVSLLSSLLSLLLAFLPRLFLADLGLAASLILQGFWSLQTGLSLYVDAFIPEGCHRLLDVVAGVEGSTVCEINESKLRAVAILDLMFAVYVVVVVVIVLAVYSAVAKAVGGRRLGAYEALPTTVAAVDTNHVQLKTITRNQE